jgi:hypothetical protein
VIDISIPDCFAIMTSSAAPEKYIARASETLSAVGKDVAIQMVGEESHSIDPAVAARAIRKIDWFLIPAMTVGVSVGRNPSEL